MLRIAPVVVPRYPHHVTQRGKRRQHPAADEPVGRVSRPDDSSRMSRMSGLLTRPARFLTNLEGLLERGLKSRKPGPKPKKRRNR